MRWQIAGLGKAQEDSAKNAGPPREQAPAKEGEDRFFVFARVRRQKNGSQPRRVNPLLQFEDTHQRKGELVGREVDAGRLGRLGLAHRC